MNVGYVFEVLFVNADKTTTTVTFSMFGKTEEEALLKAFDFLGAHFCDWNNTKIHKLEQDDD